MKTRRCRGRDLLSITSRTITAEGYLRAPGAIARVGIQRYTAKELGLDADGVDANRIFRLYRPADEVFAPDALNSFEGQAITDNHPNESVTAQNWSDYAVGDFRDVRPDGDHIAATLTIRDKAAIDAVVGGKNQLSCGYGFDLDMTPGKTADGQEYDGIQRKIAGNHLAIVDFARGGPALRIADSNRQHVRDTMAMRTIVVDGISIELESIQASIVEKVVADANKATKVAQDALAASQKVEAAAKSELADEKTKSAKLVTDHETKVKELEAKILKPEAVQALVTELTKVVGDAKKLAPELKTDGKSAAVIRAEVLMHVLGKDEALKPIAAAVLAGIEPAKATEAVAKLAFDAVLAAKASRGDDAAVDDADTSVADAIVGDGAPSAHGKAGPLSGRALFLYRQNHGGKDPEQAKA